MTDGAQDFDSKVFVIMPFGNGEQSQRHKARYDSLIRPAVKKAGEDAGKTLICIRADEIEASGRITDQVVQYLSESRLVIADLHDLNPNVMYELGVRHAVRYGTILLAPYPESPGGKVLPFDLATLDVVFYQDHIGREPEPISKLTARIRRCLNESHPTPDSPPQPFVRLSSGTVIAATTWLPLWSRLCTRWRGLLARIMSPKFYNSSRRPSKRIC